MQGTGPSKSITSQFDRRNKFSIKGFVNGLGFQVYKIENIGMNETVYVERRIFDTFRRALYKLMYSPKVPMETTISFKNKDYIQIEVDITKTHAILIKELDPGPKSTKQISLKWEAQKTLVDLLYHKNLGHPNDALDLITNYHRMFQFTFQEGSESITSDLSIRKDILSQVDRYTPGLGQKVAASTGVTTQFRNQGEATDTKKQGKHVYKPKLGDRDHHRKQRVSYESLFDAKDQSDKSPKAAENVQTNSKSLGSKTAFPLPIMTANIKAYSGSSTSFSCQFNQEEIHELRTRFIQDRSHDFFIGFEIYDCIFRRGSSLKTFRFPLYYMQVTIEESGREIFLHPKEDGAVYINHLALSNLVETFAPFEAEGGSPSKAFFKTMLAQTMKIGHRTDRIRLKRQLPIREEVFDKTRELFLGFEGENGKGGLLSHLKLIGIEVDLDAVSLYKAPRNDTPLVKALDHDLENILKIAHKTPDRFYNSLLGQFLTPELRKVKKSYTFAGTPAMPGSPPKATRNLLSKLDKHDLVLLEGPPGTGKTFTIMNLFLHCLNKGKRLLVVSDQEAAIHALTEKLSEYLFGKDRESTEARHLAYLWDAAIKVVDKAPLADNTMAQWIRILQKSLKLEDPLVHEWPQTSKDHDDKITKIDARITKFKNHIQDIMEERIGPGSDYMKKVTPRRRHATTVSDIGNLVTFLSFVNDATGGSHRIYYLKRFIEDREFILKSEFRDTYSFFRIAKDLDSYEGEVSRVYQALEIAIEAKPNSLDKLETYLPAIMPNALSQTIISWFQKEFPPAQGGARLWQIIRSLFKNSSVARIKKLRRIVKNQQVIIASLRQVDKSIRLQLNSIHDALVLPPETEVPLSLEICRFAIESNKKRALQKAKVFNPSVQESLNEIDRLQILRDQHIKENVIGRLGEIGRNLYHSENTGDTSRATSLQALLDNLKTYNTLEAATETLKDFQKQLFDAFPIWVCRKQAVSFLFPCEEKSFDLVIVDEATQCRVDDALPLLFRGEKVMVVGDEKQTVLAKNSLLDDYLFEEFDLKEQLRSSQARAIKGGGSHIFGLVKNIKQASVMLDEHYRCPPDIISYSNNYVYNGELKTMQWQTNNQPPSVIVDFSEENQANPGRNMVGKYKGLETKLIDRFLEYVASTIKEIEKSTGKRINVETDVALCYFLLKNEPYIKDAKAEFLRKLNRGSQILDGAGAALQGKERDYIFYLWDINRGNHGAFRQGDDPDKRKGELNVLMSRPKKTAFHYLHGGFASLDHSSSSIADYLWTTLNRSQASKADKVFIPRKTQPGPEFVPWRRSSGPLMESILVHSVAQGSQQHQFKKSFHFHHSITVGDPHQRVDLVISHKNKESEPSVALVDLCGFDRLMTSSDQIVDYFFQLKRAQPKLEPFFMFIHELASPQTRAYKLLQKALLKEDKKNLAS